jgi:hypothetical protein
MTAIFSYSIGGSNPAGPTAARRLFFNMPVQHNGFLAAGAGDWRGAGEGFRRGDSVNGV